MTVGEQELQAWSEAYQASPRHRIATLALSRTELQDVCCDPARAAEMRHQFSLELETLPVTNQMKSGRCWLFAAANVLRERIARELNLEQFELSQSYLAFWDKLERAHYFLNAMLETAELPADDRTVSFLLQTGVHDGGQWGMFTNIVRKYGVVPKDVYDETYQSSHTQSMNRVLNRNLKVSAIRLRKMKRENAGEEAIEAEVRAIMGRVYAFLCACYGGEPPRTFDFEYVDRDRKYHREENMTPRSFADRYVRGTLDDLVSLIHAPTKDKPYYENYTIRFLGNVVGMPGVRHLNLPMQELKEAIIRQMQDGRVVWFGSDVGKGGDREKGFWDEDTFRTEEFSGLDLAISKEDALDYGFSAMNHAMVLTGVNLVNGKPDRWRIENSWGDEKGKKGYYVCSDAWFDQYVFQAAVDRKYLGDLAGCLDKEPRELNPWDPMGTLADE